AGLYHVVNAQPAAQTPAVLQLAVDDHDLEIETGGSTATQEASPPRGVEALPIAVEPAPVTVATPATVEPAVAALASPAVRGISLAREIELIDRAMLGLRRRDLDAALETLHSYADESQGKGQLAQDAGAIEVEVLCSKRAANAATQLAAFEQRWPHS